MSGYRLTKLESESLFREIQRHQNKVPGASSLDEAELFIVYVDTFGAGSYPFSLPLFKQVVTKLRKRKTDEAIKRQRRERSVFDGEDGSSAVDQVADAQTLRSDAYMMTAEREIEALAEIERLTRDLDPRVELLVALHLENLTVPQIRTTKQGPHPTDVKRYFRTTKAETQALLAQAAAVALAYARGSGDID